MHCATTQRCGRDTSAAAGDVDHKLTGARHLPITSRVSKAYHLPITSAHRSSDSDSSGDGSENETETTDASTTAGDDDALASARERAGNEIEETVEWRREAHEAKVAEDNERKRRGDAEAKQQRRELDLERMIGMACGEGREARQLCRSIFDRIDRTKRGTIRIESLRAAFHADDEIAVLLGLPKAFHEIPPATKRTTSADAGAEEPDLVLMFLKSMLLRHPAAKGGGGRRRDRGRQIQSNGGNGGNGSSSNNLSRVQFCRYFLSRPHGVRRRGENVWVYTCVCMYVCACGVYILPPIHVVCEYKW